MGSAHSQRGLSLVSAAMALAIVAFLASSAFKVLPHYFDYMSMDKLITSVETEPTAGIRSVRDFYNYVGRGMEVNGVRDIDPEQVLRVELQNNEFRVHLKYEKREPLIANLDLVMTYDKEYRLRMP